MDNKEFYNVAIYIDYENVHKSLLAKKTNLLREGFFEKLREWCKNNNRRIVKLAAYCNFDNDDLYFSYHQTTLQSYGAETVHTSNKGKNFADMQITIDVLNSMYIDNNIDEFIIMSNDKDMTPLLNTIKLNKRKVSILTVGDQYNDLIVNFADEHITYESIKETNCSELLIHKIDDSIHDNLISFCEKSISIYQDELSRDKNFSRDKYKDFGLVYQIENGMKFYKIMVYELTLIFIAIFIKKNRFLCTIINIKDKTI